MTTIWPVMFGTQIHQHKRPPQSSPIFACVYLLLIYFFVIHFNMLENDVSPLAQQVHCIVLSVHFANDNDLINEIERKSFFISVKIENERECETGEKTTVENKVWKKWQQLIQLAHFYQWLYRTNKHTAERERETHTCSATTVSANKKRANMRITSTFFIRFGIEWNWRAEAYSVKKRRISRCNTLLHTA